MVVECPGCRNRYDVSGRPKGTQARCRCGTLFALGEAPKAQGLNCPGCGGDVTNSGSTCRYCGRALLLKACPRCFARVFHDDAHCRQCGAGVTAPIAAARSESPMICPRCESGHPLHGRLVGETLLDECERCLGVWIDNVALAHILEKRKDASVDVFLGYLPVPDLNVQGPAPDTTNKRVYIKCPSCDQVMSRVNFGRRSGVIVDHCRPHGTWFDAQELSRIIQFARSGAYEEANRRDLEERAVELRNAESRALAAKSSVHLQEPSNPSELLSDSLLTLIKSFFN